MAVKMKNRVDDEPKTLYEGAVLALRERNGYHDSDFYAVVWDAEKEAVTTIEYDTTRFAGGGSAQVDATPEVVEKATKWLARLWGDQAVTEDRERAKRPDIGREVRVTGGRKLEHGTEGRVFWHGRNTFDPSRWGRHDYERIGLELTSGERVFVSGDHVEVVKPERYHTDEVKLREAARAAAERSQAWHAPFVPPGWAML